MAVSVSYPGVYLEEAKSGVVPISGVSTSVAAFVGKLELAPIIEGDPPPSNPPAGFDKPIRVRNWGEFVTNFTKDTESELAHSVYQFFSNGGSDAIVVATKSKSAGKLTGEEDKKTGIYALLQIAPDVFNMLCIPDAAELDQADYESVYLAAHKLCQDEDALLLLDIPVKDGTTNTADWTATEMSTFLSARSMSSKDNAAVYYPRVLVPKLAGGGYESRTTSGTMAGVFARTDSEVGVWKAPAGTSAGTQGAKPERSLTDKENGDFYETNHFNCIRTFPIYGTISWGARTLSTEADRKYVPVRRTTFFLKQSLYRGLQWVVFEPNDFRLWGQIRLNVTSFMHRLFRQGAFQGETAKQAYFVKCDSETTTQADIDLGIVNIVVGFAPLKPAEFVVLTIQQIVNQDTP